jgi:hypothetical protein
MHAMEDDKIDEPPFADISPGGRALRAAKSKIKHFKSTLQRMIDAATVARNEREAHHLKEVRARLLNEAHNDVTADPSKVAADLNKSLLTAAYRAHPAHRAAFEAIRQVGSTEARNAATVPARAKRDKKSAMGLDARMAAALAEIKAKGLRVKHSMELARQIEPGMRERMGLKPGEKGLSLTSIKRALCTLKNRSSLTE